MLVSIVVALLLGSGIAGGAFYYFTGSVSQENDTQNPFKDELPSWAEEAILRMHSFDIIKGYDDGRFAPADTVTRGQVITLIDRILRSQNLTREERGCTQIYEDIPAGHYAFSAACTFQAHGWSEAGGHFHPDEASTRGMTAAFMNAVFGPSLLSDAGSSVPGNQVFRDVPPSSLFFYDSAALKEMGLMTGYPDGRFGVDDPLNRAAAAVVMDRLKTTVDQAKLRELKLDIRMRLDVPQDAIPEGVTAQDIRVSKAGSEILPDNLKNIDTLYALKFEPDGLVLKHPVGFVVTLPWEFEDIPAVLHVGKFGVELIPNLKFTMNPDAKTVTVSGEISHFSGYVFMRVDLLDVTAPDKLGPFPVGTTFPVDVTIHNYKVRSFFPQSFTVEGVHIDPPKNIGFSRTTSFSAPMLEPSEIDGRPAKGTVMTSDILSVQGRFTCVEPTRTWVHFQAEANVNYRYRGYDEDPGEAGMMWGELSTTTEVECVGPDVPYNNISADVACGGSITITGNVAGDLSDMNDLTMVSRDGLGGILSAEPLAVDPKTGAFTFSIKGPPGSYSYQLSIRNGKLVSYVVASGTYYIPPCPKPGEKEEEPWIFPTGDHGGGVILTFPLPGFHSELLDDECKKNVEECEQLERQCEDLQERDAAAEKGCQKILRSAPKVCQNLSGQATSPECVSPLKGYRKCEEQREEQYDTASNCPKQTQRCMQKNKFQECLKQGMETSASSAISLSRPASYVLSSSQSQAREEATALGVWEFLDTDADWQKVTSLPFGHRVHLIVASNPSSGTAVDMRTFLPMDLTLSVNGEQVWRSTIGEAPEQTCRGATGCSIDGPYVDPAWQSQRIELIAVGRGGEVLAVFRSP